MTLQQALAARSIGSVVIVDDCYDDFVDWLGRQSGLRQKFFEMVEQAEEEEPWDQLCRLVGSEVETAETIPDEFWIDLHNGGLEHRGALAEAWQQTVGAMWSQNGAPHLSELESLLASAGLTYESLSPGRVETWAATTHTDIVFLDYYLGAQNDEESAERAVAMAKLIYERSTGARRPMLVLMSTIESVQEAADTFREKAGLLPGSFVFASKAELRDQYQGPRRL